MLAARAASCWTQPKRRKPRADAHTYADYRSTDSSRRARARSVGEESATQGVLLVGVKDSGDPDAVVSRSRTNERASCHGQRCADTGARTQLMEVIHVHVPRTPDRQKGTSKLESNAVAGGDGGLARAHRRDHLDHRLLRRFRFEPLLASSSAASVTKRRTHLRGWALRCHHRCSVARGSGRRIIDACSTPGTESITPHESSHQDDHSAFPWDSS